MFKVHLDMLHSILAHAKAAVPLDIKELLESGCLHRCIENMLDRDDVLVSLIRFMDSISIGKKS